MSSSWLQPGALVRFGVTCGDGAGEIEWLPFFTGTIETLPETTVENVDAYVTLNLVETAALLGGWNGTAVPNEGEGDSLLQRMQRLLGDANWQAPLDIAPDAIGSAATFAATTLVKTRLIEIVDEATSVGMFALNGSDGGLVIAPHYPDQAVSSTEVFSNDPNTGAAEYPLVDVTPYASTDRIVNVAIEQRLGGVQQQAIDQASVDKFGRRLHPDSPKLDLDLLDDDTVNAVCQRLVAEGAWDSIGIQNINLDMDQDAVRMGKVMAHYASTGLEARTPFNLRWVHPSGTVFPIELVLDGFTQGITMEGTQVKWTAALSTARRFVSTQAIWGDSSDTTGAFWDAAFWAFVP